MPRKDNKSINVENVEEFQQLKNLLTSVQKSIDKLKINEEVKSQETQRKLDKLFQKMKASFVFNPHSFVENFLRCDFESIIDPSDSYGKHYSDDWYVHDNYPTFVDDAGRIIDECKQKLVNIFEKKEEESNQT